MEIKMSIIFIIVTSFVAAQNPVPCSTTDEYTCQSYYIPPNCTCNWTMISNSKGEKNCCCGRDYFLYSYPYANRHIIGLVASNNGNSTDDDSECERTTFCNRNDYDFKKGDEESSIYGDWILIWYDEFDYNILNQSFYNYLPKEKNYSSTNIVYSNSQIEISNGTLKLKSHYDPDPNKTYSYYGPQIINSTTTGNYCYPCTPRHFDYVLGRIWTDFAFPKNIRIQAKIKLHPNLSNIGTNFWMFGLSGNYQEIDIFESGKFYSPNEPLRYNPYNQQYPNYNITMTYHSTKYQQSMSYCNNQYNHRAEGVFRYTGVPLDQYFNQYDLIYDKWKIEWWFNGTIIWRVNKYYDMHNYWGESLRRANFRRVPVNNYAQYINIPDKKVAYNKYFPHIGFPSDIRFDINTLKSDGNLGNINPQQDMITPSSTGYAAEMDYLKVWIRDNCGETKIIYQNNPLLSNNAEKYTIETGKIIKTNPGSNILISAPVSWGVGSAIYAATEEIEFNDGFGVDETGNLFAFITTCENAWDYREFVLDDTLYNKANYTFENENIGKEDTDDDVHNQEISVFPLPATTHFHISIDEEDFYDLTKIEITDMLGQSKKLPKQITQDISNLSNGMYFLKFYFSNGMIVVKPLVVQR